jgi:hypothetical protein
MGRSLLALLSLSLSFGAACSDITESESSRTGRYVLARINGEMLPILFLETSAARLYFLRGEVRLNNDQTFTDITDMRVEPKIAGASISFPSDTTRGTYRMAGDTVVFTTTQAQEYRMVFQASGSLLQELVGNTLTYRR